jgi:hypothetical protein
MRLTLSPLLANLPREGAGRGAAEGQGPSLGKLSSKQAWLKAAEGLFEGRGCVLSANLVLAPPPRHCQPLHLAFF